MKKLITTVGTSLFSNYQLDVVRYEYGRDYASIDIPLKRIENKNAVDIYKPEFRAYIQSVQENIEDYWFEFKKQPNRQASAEIASILKIVSEPEAEEYIVHLVATDTLESVLAAELILTWFKQNAQAVPNITEVRFQRPPAEFKLQSQSAYVVKNLQVKDQELYDQGFINLIELLNGICDKENSILNITGGYKSIVPIMTLYGQLEELPVKYLFSEQDLSRINEVLTLGNLPISFDWYLGEPLLDYLTQDGLKKIAEDEEMISTLKSYDLVSTSNSPDNVKTLKLTALGQLFKSYVEKLSNEKKGDFGFFIELKLLEYFTDNLFNESIKRSKRYWWNQNDNTLFTVEPEAIKITEIEIDLVRVNGDDQEIWYEIKSCSSTGLKKARKQIEKKIQFWRSTNVPRPDEFHLLLYKLPRTSPSDYIRIIREIAKLFKDESCGFVLEYFDLPLKKRGIPDYKLLSSQSPTIMTFNLDNYA
jgi:CRISPR/Cas system-associated protein Csm6